MQTLDTLVVEQYDRMIGLDLADLAVDGCITKAPGGGEAAGRSPVDRGKQGRKRSTLTDAAGVPLHLVAAGANRPDAPLLGATLAGLATLGPMPDDVGVHLDRGYDSAATRALLTEFGFDGAIARKGVPAPLQAGTRWVVEMTQPHYPRGAFLPRARVACVLPPLEWGWVRPLWGGYRTSC